MQCGQGFHAFWHISVGLFGHGVRFLTQIGELVLLSSYFHIPVVFGVNVLSGLGRRLTAVT